MARRSARPAERLDGDLDAAAIAARRRLAARPASGARRQPPPRRDALRRRRLELDLSPALPGARPRAAAAACGHQGEIGARHGARIAGPLNRLARTTLSSPRRSPSAPIRRSWAATSTSCGGSTGSSCAAICLPGCASLPRPPAELCLNLIDALVALHRVDPNAAGLDDLGRGGGYARRQVAGWTDRYRKARTGNVPRAEKLMVWLSAHAPKDVGSCVIHNDFRFDNVVLDPQEPTRIVGVLDWEMATVGDPLMDLAGALAYWVEAGDDPLFRALRRQPTHLPGMLTRREVVDDLLPPKAGLPELTRGGLDLLRALRSLPPRCDRAADLPALPPQGDPQPGVPALLALRSLPDLALQPDPPAERRVSAASAGGRAIVHE